MPDILHFPSTGQHSPSSRVEAVIRSASRRRLFVLAVEHLGWAFAIGFGGGVLMLLLGTQILNWYWLVLLFAVGLGVAAFQIRKQLASRYRVAQMLDQKLSLQDSLSTAWHLLSHPGNASDSVTELEISRADEIARSVHPSSAFPLRGGRTWVASLALAAVASGLFGVRYLVSNSLSLQQPLIPINVQAAFEQTAKVQPGEHHEKRFDQAGNILDPNIPASPDAKAENPKAPNGVAPSPNTASKAESPLASNQSSPNQSPNQSQSTPDQKQSGESNGKEGSQNGSKPTAGENKDDNNKPGSENAKAQEKASENQQPSSSMMSKMKDALSSLMSKMQPNSAQKSSSSSDKPSSDKQASTQQASSEKKEQQAQSQNSSQNQDSTKEQSSEGQAQGQAAEKSQSAQGKNSEQQADKRNADAHSGVGAQDGEKAIKDAQQLQAMGKLAEIIGKRSASLTGEIVVETPSGKQQQLKTEYSQKVGQHADTGGEINRNEIPLMYQPYVRAYMEEVHKQPKNTP